MYLLQQRAQFFSAIREFFAVRNVLEVQTPILSSATIPDPALQSFETHHFNQKFYLQTSPEFFMKRLLVAGSGAIFQIAPAFRCEEEGRHHNPEFLMLEWYRPGFTMTDLMDEVETLVRILLDQFQADRREVLLYAQESWKRWKIVDAFAETTAISDLFNTSVAELQAEAIAQNIPSAVQLELDWDGWVDLLLSETVIPALDNLGQGEPFFLTHYPASQAALARLDPDDPRVAERFELTINGIEIANGFRELTDATEQRKRFESELEERKQLGLPPVKLDENFLATLEVGMPECSGVALGVERLLMVALGADRLEEVMLFPFAQV